MFYTIEGWHLRLAKDLNLNTEDLLVLAYIWSYLGNNLDCFPSIEKISICTNSSIASVKRSLVKLKDNEIIQVEKKGRCNFYTKGIKMNYYTAQNDTDKQLKMSHYNNNIYNNYKNNIVAQNEPYRKSGFDNYSKNTELTDFEVHNIEKLISKYKKNMLE